MVPVEYRLNVLDRNQEKMVVWLLNWIGYRVGERVCWTFGLSNTSSRLELLRTFIFLGWRSSRVYNLMSTLGTSVTSNHISCGFISTEDLGWVVQWIVDTEHTVQIWMLFTYTFWSYGATTFCRSLIECGLRVCEDGGQEVWKKSWSVSK